MKQTSKPTRAQRIFLSKKGIDCRLHTVRIVYENKYELRYLIDSGTEVHSIKKGER